MNQSKEYILSSEVAAIEVGEGTTRQMLGYNDDVMMVKVAFETGSIGYKHSHPHVQTTYVASGKFEVEIDGTKQILSCGDGFFVPSGKIHGVQCLEKGILIDVFAPMRQDFL